MTKREMIDEILAINLSAEPQFLARFKDKDLSDYLTHLRVLSTPRLAGEPGRFDKYFTNVPKIAAPRPQWRQTAEADEAPAEAEEAPVEDAETDAEEPVEREMSADESCVTDDSTHAEALASLEDAAASEDLAARELLAQDTDQGVGPEERQCLLDASAVADDELGESDDCDPAEMETPFRMTPPPTRAGSTRPAASSAARQMLYGLDGAQPPPRSRRGASRAQAAG